MKTLNKLLIASTMVVTLGATSCNNNQNTKSGGVPYTYFALRPMSGSDEYTVGFKYEGSKDIKVYWGIESTTPSQETSHTFKINNSKSYLPVVKIEGNVSSIWFTDEKGQSIEKDNNKITTILFSNTITSIPKYACYSLPRLSTVFIPNSVKTVGEYAFLAPAFKYAFCAPKSRPSGWDVNWGSTPFISECVVWGVNYHLVNDNLAYLTYSHNNVNEAYYCGYLYPPKTEIKKLTIPKTVDINKVKYKVATLLGVGAIASTIESITIKNNITYVGPEALSDCTKLATVNFSGDFDRLAFDDGVFSQCTSLTDIVLPEGLINLSYELFSNCEKLASVKIPNTVKWLDDEVFRNSSAGVENLAINLTSYQSAKEIATCYESPFDWSKAEKVTFTYDNAKVNYYDFMSRNWPEDGYCERGPSVQWNPAPAPAPSNKY